MKLKVNRELLALTMQTIKDNPQHWDQRNWHCGTSHCFGGTAQLLHMSLDPKLKICTVNSDYVRPLYEIATPDIKKFIEDNNIYYTAEYPEIALGLDGMTADLLFDAFNTLEDLELMVDYILEHNSLEHYEPEQRRFNV